MPRFCILSQTKSISKQNPHMIRCGEDILQGQSPSSPEHIPAKPFSAWASLMRFQKSGQICHFSAWTWRMAERTGTAGWGKGWGIQREKGHFESWEQGRVEMRAKMINTLSSDWFWNPEERSQDLEMEELEKSGEERVLWEEMNRKSASSTEYSFL